MTTHRITRIAAVAIAIAATAAPAASADPWAQDPHGLNGPVSTEERTQDLRMPDNRVPAAQPQDLRHPDTVDYAQGRGTYNAPKVVVVDLPKPVSEPVSASGIDWEDVGIGAGGLLGLSLIALGGGLVVVHRRGARQLAA